MRNKIVRIKDIAERAGVSTGTVDRVIHNRGRVAEDVRQRVQEIIKELHYEPNYEARALGSNKQYTLAAILPDYNADPYWYDPKTGIDRAEQELVQYGVNIEYFYFTQDSEQSFVDAAEKATRINPDGIVIAPVFRKEVLPYFSHWKRNKTPFVTFNTKIESSKPLCFVGQDSLNSGRLAAKLIHYGHAAENCSILMVHIDEDFENAMHLRNKEQGFRDYFEQHHLTEQYHIKRLELQRRDYLAFVRNLGNVIESTPDLRVIYVSNSKAYEIAAFLEQQNIEHIKIVGYDLVPRNVYYIRKGIISFVINQHPRGQGYRAVLQLADHLIFKKTVTAQKLLPLDIITKENLDCFIEAGYIK